MADDTIGSLTAIVRATAAQFATDINQVKATLADLKNSAESSGKGVKEALEIGAAVEIFKQGFEIAKQAAEQFFAVFEKGHQLEHLADELGSTAGELSGFEFAAMEVGQTSESFENALGKMVQKIGEAREGSEKTSVAFAALGLNVDRLAGQSAGGALETIADAMKNVSSPADRAALAVELFGKAGRDMVPLLNQGREGIEEFIRKGEELGAVITTEQAAALAEGQKHINEFKATWQGLVNTLATDVLPALNSVAKAAGDVIHKDSDFFKIINDNGGVGGLGAMLAGGDDKSLGLENQARAKAIMEEHNRQLAEAKKKNIVKQFEDEAKAAKEWQKKMREDSEADAKLVERTQAKVKRDNEDLFKNARKAVEEAGTPMEKFNEHLEKLHGFLAAGAISFQEFEKAAAHAGAEVEKTLDKHKEVRGHEMLGGIGAADINTMAGASLDLAAGRAAQAFADKDDQTAAKQLDEAKIHTDLLKAIRDHAGQPLDLAIADF